jgi:purine-nucleoside phosphorylase
MTSAVGVVAGSGIDLRGIFDQVDSETPFHAIPGLLSGHVPGHDSVFLRGRAGAVPLVLQCGRLHPYEGHPLETVTRTVDILQQFGVRVIVFTNAVGGLLPELRPGDLVAADRVRTWRYAPYALPAEMIPDFVLPHADSRGAYHWMHGPCYETRAEIAALQRLGAATVGMSTAPELLRCAQLGLRAGVVSCVTNSCVRPERLTHLHVLETAREASGRLCQLLHAALPGLAATALP